MESVSPQHMNFEAIGTRWDIVVYDELPPDTFHRLTDSVLQRIDEFDRTYSRFRQDSLAAQLAKAPGKVKLPPDSMKLFAFYQQLFDATRGKVTPLIGNVLVDAGYNPEYSLTPKGTRKAAPVWGKDVSYEAPYLHAHTPVVIDVGAAGKGYLVDLISDIFRDKGIENYLIDASGDILHQRTTGETIRIGLEHPHDSAQAIGVVELGNESICSSAITRRAWRNFHHIIDPDTATPVNDIHAVWVVASSTMLADGLATALFFTPADELRRLFDFEYCLVKSDMSYERSPGLRGEIFAERHP